MPSAESVAARRRAVYPRVVRITTWAEYGLICALHLARRAGGGPITGREMAADERLPADYVEQILLRLRRAGLVESVRGARGGYFLAKDPATISVRDVMAASEHQTFEVNCETHPVDAAQSASEVAAHRSKFTSLHLPSCAHAAVVAQSASERATQLPEIAWHWPRCWQG